MDTGAQLVKHFDWRPDGVGRCLQHERRNRANQHGLGNALGSMTPDVARDFAAASRMTNMDGILQVECRDELGEVVGVGVEIVSIPGLTRPAMAAAIMSDAPVSARSQKEHLVFEGIRGKRPAVTKDHRLTIAPIVVINLLCRPWS